MIRPLRILTPIFPMRSVICWGCSPDVGIYGSTNAIADTRDPDRRIKWLAKLDSKKDNLFRRRVDALSFSHDGKLLVGVGGDDVHSLGVWRWEEGELLATSRAHNGAFFDMRFNPFQAHALPESTGPEPGQAASIDKAVYTLVSCGQ